MDDDVVERQTVESPCGVPIGASFPIAFIARHQTLEFGGRGGEAGDGGEGGAVMESSGTDAAHRGRNGDGGQFGPAAETTVRHGCQAAGAAEVQEFHV